MECFCGPQRLFLSEAWPPLPAMGKKSVIPESLMATAAAARAAKAAKDAQESVPSLHVFVCKTYVSLNICINKL